MDHGMAVWTDRAQILNGVNLVTLPNLGYGHKVVDVNVACPKGPIALFEHEVTHDAGQSIVVDTSPPSSTITFV